MGQTIERMACRGKKGLGQTAREAMLLRDWTINESMRPAPRLAVSNRIQMRHSAQYASRSTLVHCEDHLQGMTCSAGRTPAHSKQARSRQAPTSHWQPPITLTRAPSCVGLWLILAAAPAGRGLWRSGQAGLLDRPGHHAPPSPPFLMEDSSAARFSRPR